MKEAHKQSTIICATYCNDESGPLQMTAGDCMTTPCVTVSESASIEECCRLMEQNRIRRIPVVDSGGSCCGIISQADLATTMDRVAAEVLRQVSQPTSEPSLVRRH